MLLMRRYSRITFDNRSLKMETIEVNQIFKRKCSVQMKITDSQEEISLYQTCRALTWFQP